MKKFLMAAAAMLCAGAANATTINFDEMSAGNCNYRGPSATSNGYVFTSQHVYTCEAGGVGAGNTSRALVGYTQGYLSFARQDGGAFSLQSLFTGDPYYYNDGPTGVSVVGNLIAGGQVSAFLEFDGLAFKQYDFSAAFAGLSSVTLQLLVSPGGYAGMVMIDNLVVDEPVEIPAQVPEPAMLGLFGIGLLGLARLRRRRAA